MANPTPPRKSSILYKDFVEVGEMSLCGLTISGEDDKVRSEYGSCTISPYEYLISTRRGHLPFTAFEFSVFKYLMVAPS